MSNRRVHDIKWDLEFCENKIKSTKLFLLLSIISEVGLSILFYIFVTGKGNVFDYIVSITILLFFLYQLFRQSSLIKKRFKQRKTFQREYDIATETPEQRQARQRSEKFSRILKEEKV